MYYAGKGVGKDYQQALAYFKKACELGYEEACSKSL
ncbi:SEL1-like repeat protein [Helicobacter suis]